MTFLPDSCQTWYKVCPWKVDDPYWYSGYMVKDQGSTSGFLSMRPWSMMSFIMGGNGIIESSLSSCLNIHVGLSVKPFNRKGGISKCLRIPA